MVPQTLSCLVRDNAISKTMWVDSIICHRDKMWQLWRVRWRVGHSQCVCHTKIHLASSLQDSSHNYPVTGPCHTPDTPSLSSQWSPPPTPLVRALQSCGWWDSIMQHISLASYKISSPKSITMTQTRTGVMTRKLTEGHKTWLLISNIQIFKHCVI